MKKVIALGLFFVITLIHAQKPKLHSHNDYHQEIPFWKAYSCGFESIEVDVFLKDGVLYATHDEKDIIPNRTIESLYLEPLAKAEALKIGTQHVQLLIDFKSEAYSTLKALLKVLTRYPTLTQSGRYTFVISGNRPKVLDYAKYPNYIQFDYQTLEAIPSAVTHKVAMVSLGFKKYADWEGVHPLDSTTYAQLNQMVATAHAMDKPFRFWAFPDTPLAWQTALDLGIDYINTDQPYECSAFVKKKTATKIAFLADVHLQDLYGTLDDTFYQGVKHPVTGQPTLLRTMASQLHSTRIFNENYFAFITALDQIAASGIKLVALPGDYTDDGQPIHVRGLAKILASYEEQYGMQFFITTGNHDPVGPFLQPAGKNDFLGEGGKAQPIFSTAAMYTPTENEHEVVVSSAIAKMGYDGILSTLKDFGFYPKKEYLYWSTPFASYTYDTYTFEAAQNEAILSKRTYEVTEGFTVPDVSYVVEPVEGLWLMAIDGDVYLPKDSNGDPNDARNYHGASLGYNNVLSNKAHLITWAKAVAKAAKEQGKTLIAFSHFPMVDFNDDASGTLKDLLGSNKWQLARVPDEAVANAFADAGIHIHVAGHMHINDTGVRTTQNGSRLVNIQTPSLAAYIPGYKVLTVHDDATLEVETVTLDEVKNFDTLFPLYQQEYAYLQATTADLWNAEVLQAKSYHDFMLWHLKELVRLRFLNDWPTPIKDFLLNNSLAEIGAEAGVQLADGAYSYTGEAMLLDFYKLRNADVLALQDISTQQLHYYQQLIRAYKTLKPKTELLVQLQQFFSAMDAFMHGAPANHFKVDLRSGKIIGS